MGPAVSELEAAPRIQGGPSLAALSRAYLRPPLRKTPTGETGEVWARPPEETLREGFSR